MVRNPVPHDHRAPSPGIEQRNVVMKIRTVLMAIAATSALSTGAFAATHVDNAHDSGHPTTREQMSAACSALQSQYNSVIEGKIDTPKMDKASGLHAQGVDACNSNNSDIGVLKLKEALRELGVKPVN
jgi:hypothetical protein